MCLLLPEKLAVNLNSRASMADQKDSHSAALDQRSVSSGTGNVVLHPLERCKSQGRTPKAHEVTCKPQTKALADAFLEEAFMAFCIGPEPTICVGACLFLFLYAQEHGISPAILLAPVAECLGRNAVGLLKFLHKQAVFRRDGTLNTQRCTSPINTAWKSRKRKATARYSVAKNGVVQAWIDFC